MIKRIKNNPFALVKIIICIILIAFAFTFNHARGIVETATTNIDSTGIQFYNAKIEQYNGNDLSRAQIRSFIDMINTDKKINDFSYDFYGKVRVHYYALNESGDNYFDYNEIIPSDIMRKTMKFSIVSIGYFSENGAISDVAIIEQPNERNIDTRVVYHSMKEVGIDSYSRSNISNKEKFMINPDVLFIVIALIVYIVYNIILLIKNTYLKSTLIFDFVLNIIISIPLLLIALLAGFSILLPIALIIAIVLYIFLIKGIIKTKNVKMDELVEINALTGYQFASIANLIINTFAFLFLNVYLLG